MQAGLETFNQQPCSPESCHSVTLARILLFLKAAPFFAKKVTAAISFSAVNTLAFWTPKSGPPQFSTWMFMSSFLPFCGFMVSGELLKQLGLLLALVNVMVPLFSGACHVFGSLAASQVFFG